MEVDMGRSLGGSGRRKTITISGYVITVVAAVTSRPLYKDQMWLFRRIRPEIFGSKHSEQQVSSEDYHTIV
jgi:hypothetical protein